MRISIPTHWKLLISMGILTCSIDGSFAGVRYQVSNLERSTEFPISIEDIGSSERVLVISDGKINQLRETKTGAKIRSRYPRTSVLSTCILGENDADMRRSGWITDLGKTRSLLSSGMIPQKQIQSKFSYIHIDNSAEKPFEQFRDQVFDVILAKHVFCFCQSDAFSCGEIKGEVEFIRDYVSELIRLLTPRSESFIWISPILTALRSSQVDQRKIERIWNQVLNEISELADFEVISFAESGKSLKIIQSTKNLSTAQ